MIAAQHKFAFAGLLASVATASSGSFLFAQPQEGVKELATEIHDIADDPAFVETVLQLLPVHASAIMKEGDDAIRVPQDEIYASASAAIRGCLADALRPEVFPRGIRAETVELYGLQKGESGGVNAEFQWGNVELRLSGGGRGLGVRLRVPDGKVVESNPLEEPGLTQLYSLMKRLFRIPYDPTKEGELHGKATLITGTTVYTASIERLGAEVSKKWMERRDSEIKCFDHLYVFVSDSTPQYISFTLSACGPPQEANEVNRSSRPQPPFPLRVLPPPGPQPGDDDPDVANRPSFRRALVRQRMVGMGADLGRGRDSTPAPRVRGDAIPAELIGVVWENIARVVPPGVRPGSARAVEWEMLDQYGDRAPQQNPIRAEWSRGSRTFIVDGTGDSGTIILTIKQNGEERIGFHVRSGADHGPGRDPRPQDIILDKPQLHTLLTSLAGFPFTDPDEFIVTSHEREVEGVPVLWAELRSRRSQLPPEASGSIRHEDRAWFDEARIFMTDSDPQYVCITIDTARR